MSYEPDVRAQARLKIGLVAHAYPPFPASGALRAEKVARALQAAGHDVFVVTSRLPGESGRPRVAERGLQVRPVRTWPNPRHLYVWGKTLGRRIRRVDRRGSDSGGEPVGDHSVATWKRVIFSLLWLPDDLQGFVPPAVLALLRIPGRLDRVYTTAPPHSAHLAGAALRMLSGVPWIAEYRDPWMGSNVWVKPPSHRTRMTDWLEERLERWCLRRADRTVAVSEGIRELLAEKVGEGYSGKLTVARNGIERIGAEPTPHRPGEPFRIVHLGNLYMQRDPRAFLTALGQLRRDRGLGPADIELQLVGENREFRGVSVEEMAAEVGISDWLRFRPWVPHAETAAILDGADLLLLFAQGQPRQVPNKLYEYLGTGRPIFAVADEAGETARMLRAAGGHFLVTRDHPEAIAAQFREAWAQRGAPATVNRAVLEEWRTERQMEKVVEAVMLAGDRRSTAPDRPDLE